ncbi:MAG: phosphatidylinositol mannoside acyltransferase [Actinomycetia bacterium]|nr:phosphatidylinositol mannoside acyltransferase [Actinomycetes bacterium]MCP5034230.1 phosphatidylinositol mannoside acyltransferase [Actinomycetes bacterium]
MVSRPLLTFQLASAAARLVPFGLLCEGADRAGAALGPRLMPAKAAQLSRHVKRADPTLTDEEARRIAAQGLGSYGRYWAESFRLPHLSNRIIDRGFSVEGYDRIQSVLDSGIGPILVLPHLGAWEWAAAWVSRIVGVRVAAVVERLEPHDVFDWFVELRSAYGIDVIPLGPDAVAHLIKAVRAKDIVCLLSDRDLTGNGIEVSFFGEKTTLPAGPALLARRTGSPLLPVAIYYRGRTRLGFVDEPIWADPDSSLRADAKRMTQAMATAMEQLIRAAPEQWHLLEPNWPSDRLESVSSTPG